MAERTERETPISKSQFRSQYVPNFYCFVALLFQFFAISLYKADLSGSRYCLRSASLPLYNFFQSNLHKIAHFLEAFLLHSIYSSIACNYLPHKGLVF